MVVQCIVFCMQYCNEFFFVYILFCWIVYGVRYFYVIGRLGVGNGIGIIVGFEKVGGYFLFCFDFGKVFVNIWSKVDF